GCSQLKSLTGSDDIPLKFSNLIQLQISECPELTDINLKAPSLSYLSVQKNPQLKSIKIDTDTYFQIDIDEPPEVSTKTRLRLWSEYALKTKDNQISLRSPNSYVKYVQEDQHIQQLLFQVIKRSKKEPFMASAAATAISFLNLADVSFAGQDFRDI